MRKTLTYLLFLAGIFCCKHSFAQGNTYHIPGANSDAQFIFPFWLEDLNGNKDTLYVCFDQNWNNTPNDSYTHQLGHYPRPVSQGAYVASTDCQHLNSDTVLKTCGTDSWTCFSADIWIRFKNINSKQIKLSWDEQLLRKAILPYPSNANLPKAMGVLSFAQPPSTVPGPFYLNADDVVYFSDTLDPHQYFFYHPINTLLIDWSTAPGDLVKFRFWLRQWNDFTGIKPILGVKTSTLALCRFSNDNIQINGLEDQLNNTITLYDMNGRCLLTTNTKSETTMININSFATGVYTLTVSNMKEAKSFKISKE